MSKVKFKSLTDSGSALNEDLIGHYEKTFWIMDGATPLSKSHFLPSPSDAQWFVKELDSSLTSILNQEDTPDLKSLLNLALTQVEQSVLNLGIDVTKMTLFEIPSCSLNILRVNSNTLEYLTLGDCSLIFHYRDHLLEVKDKTVVALDNSVLQKLRSQRLKGNLDRNELEAYRMSLLQKNRSLMNSSEGYWTCTWDRKGVAHATLGSLDLDSDINVLSCTDGFSRLVDLYSTCKWEDLLLQKLSLQNALDLIRDIESKDNTMEQFERLKISDDASALLLSISL